MRIQRLSAALILVLALWVGKAQVGGQNKSDSTAKKDSTAKPATSEARELFYLAVAPKEKLAPIRRASDTPGTKPPGPSTTGPASTQASAAPPPAHNLGIRYNLMLVDSKNHGTPVDSDHVFRRGDEVALEVEANHSGYLYVLARQSSGEFRALLPSEEMTDQSNIIDPGKRIRIPENYTFVIQDPPGAEHLVLIFSRDPQDFDDIYEKIRNQQNPSRRLPAGNVQMAQARMNDAVNRMEEQFGTRDIAIRKVSQPLQSGEPAGSVYVVNTSAIPSSSIVTELQIRH
ncbi:MAG TPA: DUF4384 domain-containing protein [Verrucomicrobiae bacterium]|nr:DUF4384 domain-containing protein [Verrucomicrobiae bacterium]